MDWNFNRWGEALWVEGVSPGPHKINESSIHFKRWCETFWVERFPLGLTKSMRVALMSIHFNRWGEALWVEGVSPGPHEFKEGCPREFLN